MIWESTNWRLPTHAQAISEVHMRIEALIGPSQREVSRLLGGAMMRYLRAVCWMALMLAASAHAQSVAHARQLFDDSRFDASKAELLQVQKANDRIAASWYYLGRIALYDNDDDEGIHRFERAVELEDGNALYHHWLGTAIGGVALRANKFKQPFLARRIRKEWERAVELDPEYVDARISLAGFYAVAPGIMGGGLDKARAQAAEITRRNAMRGAMTRALIAAREKNGAEEEATYQQAITAAPDSAAPYFALATAYARDAKADDALAAIGRYAKRHPNDAWSLYHTGRTAGTTGQQLDRGETALRQFLMSPPSDAHPSAFAGAHYALGQIARHQGATDAAREHFRAALKLNPNMQAAQRELDSMK